MKYRHVIDMFLVCEALHMLTMAAMAFMPSHHMHWLGDVPGGILGVAVVAAE